MDVEKENPVLSVVIPVLNEEENIARLVERLNEELNKIDILNEIILIDDGSIDGTWSEIQVAGAKYSNVRGIQFSRNFGHQHAIFAGLKCSKGEAVVSMDGDLQHPPEVIGTLFQAWKDGAKIVNTIREDVEVSGFFKRGFSKAFYKIFSVLSDVSLDPGSSDFRLIDRAVLKEIVSFGDVDLFLRGAIQWVGFEVKYVKFKAEPRFQGTTKFTPFRMLALASGAIVSYSTIPLKAGVWIGLGTSAFSFFELGYVFYIYSQGITVPGWASTLGIISFFFGVLFINVGVIGIYLARIHKSLQNRPAYIVKDSCPVESRGGQE